MTGLGRVLLVVVLCAGAVVSVASAAGLTVPSSGALGAGDRVVSSCDDQVAIAYGTGVVGGQVRLQTVTVSGIAPACQGNGHVLVLTVTGGGGVILANFTTFSISPGQSSETYTLTPAPPVTSVGDLHVQIFQPF